MPNVAKLRARASASLTSLSTKLSVAVVLGIAALPLAPQHGASTIGPREAGPPLPIALVRAMPVAAAAAVAPAAVEPPLPARATPAPLATEAPAPEAGSVVLAARRSRGREDRHEEKREPQRQNSAIAPPAPPPEPVKTTPVPPPEAKPETAQAEPPKPDVWTDAEVIAALRECVRLLAPIAGEVEVAEPVKQEQCGTPAPVLLKRIGSGANRVEINPPAMLNCAMVVSLHSFVEKTLQPAAQEAFGSPIARLRNASGYSCRNRNGSLYGADKLSEHARANAIDIAGFVTADGRSIEVARFWGLTVRDEREAERLAAARAKDTPKPGKEPERAPSEATRPSHISAIAVLPAEHDGRDGRKAQTQAPAKDARKGRDEDDDDGGRPQRAERGSKVSAIAVKVSDKVSDGRGGRDATPARTAKLEPPDRSASDAKPDAKAIPASPAAPVDARKSAEAMFLRRLHKGACGVFGTVLGPEANDAHRDHFHFDLAARKRSAYCQ